MNESEIEEGDNMLTLFYRGSAIVPGEVTFDDLQYVHMQTPVKTKSWGNLIADVTKQKKSKGLLHLIHSPKNIG